MPGAVTTFEIVGDTPGNIHFSDGVTNPGFPSYYLLPFLQVVIVNSFDNSVITLQETVLEATINYGYDIGVATAEIQLTVDPNVSNYSRVQIFTGCDQNSVNLRALRFSGLFLRTEAAMWPHVYSMVCRGNLYLAMQYRQANFAGLPTSLLSESIMPGQPLIDTVDGNTGELVHGYVSGTLGVDTTDQNIVYSILQQVPILGPMVDRSDINGTSLVVVASLWDLLWPPYKSAWDMIQMVDQSFLGFRTYEDLGGVVRREQIFGYPHGVSDTQFTEGVDIWEAHGTRTIEPLINGVYVEGNVDSRSGLPNGIIYAYLQSANPFQSSDQPVIEQFRGTMIETSDLLEAEAGPSAVPLLNADRVAEWRLAEGNRQLVNVQFTTFRDDLIRIGHTIAVVTPHAAVTEPVWVQHVTIKVGSDPASWQQTISCLGGGAPGFTGGSGAIGSGSSTTVIVTTDTYTPNALIGLTFSLITAGDPANLGLAFVISGNTANSVTLSGGFPSPPLEDDTYSIGTPPPP